MRTTNRQSPETKTILVVLDLSYASAREQLSGIYRFQQARNTWNIRLIPSNDPRFQPAIFQSLAEHIDGAIVKTGSALDTTPILNDKNFPLVILERPDLDQTTPPDRPFAIVGIDNSKVGKLAATHLSALGNFATYL